MMLGAKMPSGMDGRKELACGSQAFIATLPFDPSITVFPAIVALFILSAAQLELVF